VQRVDFHVLPGTEARERLKYACRVVETAYLAGQRVLVWFDEPAELSTFDTLLWTFADRSFVPHEVLAGEPDWDEAPVWLGSAQPPQGDCDVLVNLAATVPAVARHAARVIEIIDGNEACRSAGRTRFRSYRDRGTEPVTHTIGGPTPAP
jgi:DNA polymerase-3 subunit chi